jgi:hypothetical protein
MGVYRVEQEIRKPYYLIRMKRGYIIHHGNIPNPDGGGSWLKLYLTDDEFKRYDRNKIIELLKPYTDITNRRINYCPSELLLWAIAEVIYRNNDKED